MNMKQTLLNYLNLHKWKVYGGCFLLLEVYAVVFVLWPEITSVLEIRQELHQRAVQIRSVNSGESQIEVLQRREEKLQQRLKDIYVRLPSSDRISILTGFLNKQAQRHEVSFKWIRPEPYRQQKQHIEIPVRLGAVGSFHGLARFINALENSSYIIRVRTVKFGKQQFTDRQITAELEFDLIVLNEDTLKATDDV